MSSNGPLVSVFMPAYNQERFVAEAIESVLAQSYANLEIVIGDDCSTDGTWAIVQDYQRRWPEQMRAFRNTRNLGIAGNCNEVLGRCTGEFVAFHAGDDVWLPEKIEKQVALMTTHPDCPLCYHDLEVFDSDSGATLHYWNRGPGRPQPIVGASARVLDALVADVAGFVGALSVMVRRSLLPKDARYDLRLPHLSELSLWVALLTNADGEVRYVPEVLARYRKHGGGVAGGDNETEVDTFLAIVENEHPELVDAVRRARGRRYYTKGVASVLAGDRRQALRHLGVGMRYSVYSPKVLYWLARALLRV